MHALCHDVIFFCVIFSYMFHFPGLTLTVLDKTMYIYTRSMAYYDTSGVRIKTETKSKPKLVFKTASKYFCLQFHAENKTDILDKKHLSDFLVPQ